jgi:hypothetical protein
VLGEVFMQQRHSKLIELAARPNRSPWAAWVSRLERGSRGFSERHDKNLARFGSKKNDSLVGDAMAAEAELERVRSFCVSARSRADPGLLQPSAEHIAYWDMS